MLNSVCMLDNTAPVKKQANIYIVHPSHAAVTQVLSIIMLVVLLWLSVMIAAAVVVCVVVCGCRITAMRRPVASQINIEESKASEYVIIKDDNGNDDDYDGDNDDDADDDVDEDDDNDDDDDDNAITKASMK